MDERPILLRLSTTIYSDQESDWCIQRIVHPGKILNRKRLRDKVAIITGAGSGIGRAASLLFANEGARVAVVDCYRAGGEETTKLVKKSKGEAIFIEADVSKVSDAERLVRTAVEIYGKLDILYNNAGIMKPNRALVECSEEEWDKFLDVNLKGTFLCSKFAIPEMVKSGGGSIINTGSEMGLVGCDGAPAYSASKAGVISLTRSMASEYTQSNIRVNCINPGTIETHPRSSEETRQVIARVCPSGRMGKPEEVAYLALFLASDESSFISGASIEVGGGAPLCRVPIKRYIQLY
jgi:NAD(P)-dependent dehydrogenase (short-subunit alcohol dehydrogenase family)